MYTIITPHQFLRQARKFFKNHTDLKARFGRVLSDLQSDPFQTHLELHPLSGKLEGCFAVGLTHSFRNTLMLMISAREIILLDVGSPDEVYG